MRLEVLIVANVASNEVTTNVDVMCFVTVRKCNFVVCRRNERFHAKWLKLVLRAPSSVEDIEKNKLEWLKHCMAWNLTSAWRPKNIPCCMILCVGSQFVIKFYSLCIINISTVQWPSSLDCPRRRVAQTSMKLKWIELSLVVSKSYKSYILGVA